MIIVTTPEQDKLVAEWYAKHVRAHVEANCEPPGYVIQIDLGIPEFMGYSAVAICGRDRLEVGDVQVSFDK